MGCFSEDRSDIIFLLIHTGARAHSQCELTIRLHLLKRCLPPSLPLQSPLAGRGGNITGEGTHSGVRTWRGGGSVEVHFPYSIFCSICHHPQQPQAQQDPSAMLRCIPVWHGTNSWPIKWHMGVLMEFHW